MEVGLVRKINIDEEMQQAYLDYAMSVIVARALPDARDGLKPVHRRILYAMYDMGLRPDSGYKKSARVVGEVLGKYHPHSDAAVYDAMARMVQDFSMRYPLVDGQGNFGSVDGDPPAAMRYTEARMAAVALDMMADIAKDTVDYNDNFDDTLQEPTVLPAAQPNLLLNGASGIAVGMSTNVPPHNLTELVQAIHYMLANWKKVDDISVDDLMQFIQGPDFPTGGLIIQKPDTEGLASAYGSGRGRVTVQARVHVEEMSRGRQRIIVTELPYQTNKSSLIERIATLARDGKLEGLSDLRDESDRSGMRIVIELSKNANADQVLADLYRRTPMQTTFSIIMLALVDGEPRLLNLKQALKVYIEHRLEVVKRRSEFDLARAKERAHILEGYLIGLENLDEVIQLIRKSRDVNTARNNLMRGYKLKEIQAQAILDMPLRRLAALERKKIETEYKEVQKNITALQRLLKSPVKMRQAIADELDAVREAYGDRRRTQIVELKSGQTQTKALKAQDLVAESTVWVSVSTTGLISRSVEDKAPRPSGRAAPLVALRVNTKDTLYLITETGKTAAIAAHTLPEAADPEQGEHFSRVSPLFEKDKLTAVFSLPPDATSLEDCYVVAATPGGMVKKSALSELSGPAAQTFRLLNVRKGDRLGWVGVTNGSDDLLFVTKQGMAIRFSEQEVRPMGLMAAGVNAIKLKKGDEVSGMQVVNDKYEAFLLAVDGQAKRVKVQDFPVQGRYGQGVIVWKLAAGQTLAGVVVDKPNLKITVHQRKLAPKSTRLDDAPVRTRPSGGQDVVPVKHEITHITIPSETPPELVRRLNAKGRANGRKSAAGGKTGVKKAAARKRSTATRKTTPKKKTSARAGTMKRKTTSRKKTSARASTSKRKATQRKKTDTSKRKNTRKKSS